MTQDVFETANELLSSSMNEWGLTLATSGALDPVWAQVYCDPFLRRLLLRYVKPSVQTFLVFDNE